MIRFETSPDKYRHWKLAVDGELAFLDMDVREDEPLVPGYRLKLNSYDLGVDIELADAVRRLPFECPQVKAVVLRSAKPGIFCAGANIFMLGSSSHAFKVNFCKFTNETRLAIEEASRSGGQRYIAACGGTTAGGGYELALACAEIILVDDGNSAVSLPESPLLAVLPGTGGLTRLVDKRKVRRDRADVFCTLAEGIKGARALEWGLVDALVPRSRFDAFVMQRAREAAERDTRRRSGPIRLDALEPRISSDAIRYRHVTLDLDRERRTATLRIAGPEGPQPGDPRSIREAGSDYWPLRAFREIDHALLHLRFNEPETGIVLLRTSGDLDAVQRCDEVLSAHKSDWLVGQVLTLMRQVLKRLEQTSRTMLALIEPDSCFAGSLLELVLAADRSYMLDSPKAENCLAITELNAGLLPMSNGLSRLQSRFLGEPERVSIILAHRAPFTPRDAESLGLVTFAIDELDYEDDVRIAIEERASFSPDALTGMEASLRFAGPETIETKIFGRLSAWQNWIFSRPNAVGEHGALTLYGRPERPAFDWRRT
jgi:benzoyl-CoA-dihydrodiol lyase